MAVSAWKSIRLLQNLRKNLKTSCVCKKTSVSLQYASGSLSCGRSFTSATQQHVKEKEDPVSPKVDDPDSEEERKKREASWKTVKYGFTAIGVSLGLAGAYAIIELGSPEKDDQGNRIDDEFTDMPIVPQYLRRTWRQMNYFKKMIREPSRDKLLPDPLTWPYTQPPYTLVLEMTDVLVHPDWTYQTGWRFKKRPGVDQFLEQVAPPLFEVVVFTAEQGMTVFPILDALDPNGYIMYRLVRDATHFVDGHHVKNLDCLNRDLSKVIVVDWNGESVKFHHRNTLLVPRWRGNDDDRSLLDLAAFLRTIAVTKVDDVREVLDYYHQFDNPIEAFRENQRKLVEQLEEKEKQQQEKQRGSALTKNWTSSFLQQRKL